jgi:hypothetical protein
MHTDESLDLLEKTTITLGIMLRSFRDTICVNYNTRELRKEVIARRRRDLERTQMRGSSDQTPVDGPANASQSSEPIGANSGSINTTNILSGMRESHTIVQLAPNRADTSSLILASDHSEHGCETAVTIDKKRSQQLIQHIGTERRRKGFNLNTYKFHAMGDYVETIKVLGTTDSYTTEMVYFQRFCVTQYSLLLIGGT